MSTTPSPIRVAASAAYPVCMACTKVERVTVLATDPITHVEECHPESTVAVRAQFAPRHQKINRRAH